jgi:tetratricopeptide (TPR) repeat protein
VTWARRSLLLVFGTASLGCSSLAFVTTEPGDCSEAHVAYVFGFSLDGHAPVLEHEYLDQLCDGDGALISDAARRRMDRSHYEVGRALARQGRTDLAIAALRRDIEGATEVAARRVARLEIAKLLSEIGDHDAALRELDLCDEERDGEPSWGVDHTRADVLTAAGRGREAIPVLEAWTTTDRPYLYRTTQLRIAALWLEAGELGRARAAYEAVLQCEGRCESAEILDARVGLARVLQSQQRPHEALAVVERVLEHTEDDVYWPDHDEAWRLRAQLQLELGNPMGAAASVRRAFDWQHRWTEPSAIAKAHHRSKLASLHLRAKRPDLAFAGFKAAYLTYLREFGLLDAHTLIAAHNVGVACLDLDEPYLAISWLDLAASNHEDASVDPYDRGLTQLSLGRAAQRLGRAAEAARSMSAALDLLGPLDDVRLTDGFRARMYRDAGRAFLDVGACERAPALIELAQRHYAQMGDVRSVEDLTDSERRLDQLNRCLSR